MDLRRLVCLLAIFCLLTGFCDASALEAGDVCVAVGADLSEDQIKDVYEIFGKKRGEVPEVTVTNAEERQYLEGLAEESVIGTRSVSCACVEILPADSGLRVEVSNIGWCTEEMYRSALLTAGVKDAELLVTAPFEVSGTAALTGIYKAYEDMSGQTLGEPEKSAGTQELVVTAELADEIGSSDAVSVVNELKLVLGQTREMSDEELKEQIDEIASDIGVEFVDSQKEQLVSLCRTLEKLNVDELKEKAEQVRETMEKLNEKAEQVQETVQKLNEAKDKAAGFIQSVQKLLSAIMEFFSSVLNK
ncbi:MAG: DUF1002 domain-containing protein [Eubacteriales bacterium]|nr:DUF1002 domain-containing protein [Eubacteriales bacterium]